MKKLLFLSALFLLALIFAPKIAVAKGTFGCRWASRGCGIDYDTANCTDQSQIDPSYCGQFNRDRSACDNAPRKECIEILSCTEDLKGTCTRITNRGCGPDRKNEGRQDCEANYICCVTEAKQRIFCDDKGEATSNPNITGELYTAIGCIPIEDTDAFIGFILRWAIGIGGGIAFLLIIFAGFQIMTSAGNPERLQAGRELLTSAIAGLILLIFSVFILKIIGVDILKLPGFGQ